MKRASSPVAERSGFALAASRERAGGLSLGLTAAELERTSVGKGAQIHDLKLDFRVGKAGLRVDGASDSSAPLERVLTYHRNAVVASLASLA